MGVVRTYKFMVYGPLRISSTNVKYATLSEHYASGVSISFSGVFFERDGPVENEFLVLQI